jgi:galactokinase
LQPSTALFHEKFGEPHALHQDAPRLATAPGRVNLIGDHTDYNGLPVFPMALERRVSILFRARPDAQVRIASADGYADREFRIGREIEPFAPGDWGNYVKASARALARRYGDLRGMDAAVTGDIPAAAGLSSSSAMVVASALALLDVNGISATFVDLMELLPEGEQYVGTRGGGMDHAVCLGGEEGKALKIDFTPFRIHPTPVPADWCFLVGHSLVRAEKSSAVKEAYNSRRFQCQAALEQFGAGVRYPDLLRDYPLEELVRRAPNPRFRHVVTEAARVEEARASMCAGELGRFGELMQASHASLRDDFEVSHPEVDRLVESFLHAGAAGARVTGAGFGGCAVALCRAREKERVLRGVEDGFYAVRPQRSGFAEYLLEARPAVGARVGLPE